MTKGMNAATGAALSGMAHLRQSISDILSTPKMTRVMRLDYGSRLPELIDAPMGSALLVDIYAETALALDRWEPRYKVSRIKVTKAAAGRLSIYLEGLYLPEGRPLTMEGILV